MKDYSKSKPQKRSLFVHLKSWKALLLLTTILLIYTVHFPSPALMQVPNPKIASVSAPTSVNVGQSFRVTVTVNNVYRGSEARVKILDPSTGRTWDSPTYGGTTDGVIRATLTITAPSRAGQWCLKALLEYRTLIDTVPFRMVDQYGFCVTVVAPPIPSPTPPTPTPTPPIPTPIPTPTPPVTVVVRTDWAVGRVWIDPERRRPDLTIPYINANESVTFHGMVYLRSIEVSPPEYRASMLTYVTAQVMFLLDGTVRSDLFPLQLLDYRVGDRGEEVRTRGIIGTDGGRVHTFGFRVIPYFTDPQPRDNENATQFIVAGLPSARIVTVARPNSTAVGTTVSINVTVQWSATFGADLRVVLIDRGDGNFSGRTFTNMTREKRISGFSSADAFTFTVTAPSRAMLWHLRVEAWTRAAGSTMWRHDSTDWSRDFTIYVREQRFSAKVAGVGSPGTVLPGSRFSVSAIIKYDFTSPTRTRVMAANQTSVTEMLTGRGEKTYIFNVTAPSVQGPFEIRVQVEYQRGPTDASWQHDREQWYKTLKINVSEIRAWPFLSWWYERIEKPFNDMIIGPIRRLLGT